MPHPRFALPLGTLLLLATAGTAIAPGPGPFAGFLKELRQKLGWYEQRVPAERVYVLTDKTLYAPGEAIWLTAFVRDGATLAPLKDAGGVTVELLDPKGSPSATIRLQADAHGLAKGDFQLTEAMPGGLYKLRAYTDRMAAFKDDTAVARFEKTLQVQAVVLPRVKLTLDFPRKAYGPGDEVLATLKAFGNDNQPLNGRAVQFSARVDNQEVANSTATVGADGTTALRFTLPKNLTSPDGLLTVTLQHEGLTESVARAVPIVLNRIKLQLLPEGGDLIEGLAGRVAVRATNEFGEPADVAGTVIDDRGRKLTTFTSIHDGLAAFELTPEKGRTYRVRLTQPTTTDSLVEVPAPLPGGYALRVDRQQGRDLPVTVAATVSEKVLVVGVQRGRLVLERTVDVAKGKTSTVRLPVGELPAGVVQLTVFDAKHIARAERLAFVNKDKQLHLEIKPDKERYAPREKVRLTVTATDERGLPVMGAVALSVVDDQNLTFADDKQSNLLTWLLAEADVKQPVREPKFYFDPTEKQTDIALDLVLLTHGWRRFTWQKVQAETAPLPPPPMYDRMEMAAMAAPPGNRLRMRKGVNEGALPQVAVNKAVMMDAPMAEEERALGFAGDADDAGGRDAAGAEDVAKQAEVDAPMPPRRPDIWPVVAPMPRPAPDANGFYRAREFPAPVYDKNQLQSPERTDFRTTLFWKPVVELGKSGRAVVEFYNADAITSYRATVEGLADDGTAGRAEAKFFTQQPLALAVKLPPHVVLGDTLALPVVVTNNTDQPISGPCGVNVPAGWRVVGSVPGNLTVKAHSSATVAPRYVIAGSDGSAEVAIIFGSPDGLHDSFRRTLPVLPMGYPMSKAFSGSEAKKTYTLAATGALPGTLRLTLTAFPSVETDILKGIAAILQEPSGCFEQTSTTSYPNALVLDYLRQERNPDPALVAKAEALLDRGYAKLTAYETKEKGYEWFGGSPAHEALTAYGLLQFNDMRRVRPSTVSDAMVERTHNWLMARRDGKGGFLKSPQALDQFGRADEDVTNAYIVYSLAEAGYRDIATELTAATEKARTNGDPYQLALVANALLAYKDEARARPLLTALYGKQAADGSWNGAKHSVTYSTGQALKVETTALAILATIKDERRPGQALQSGIRYLIGARSGAGNFSSTQGTILALKALTSYSRFAQQTTEDGSVAVWVDGKEVGRVAYKAGQREEVRLDGLEKFLTTPGEHKLEVRYADGVKSPLPYTLAADWRTLQQPSSDQCAVRLTTALSGTTAKTGESLRLTATLTNTDAAKGQPMTMALLGLPAGLTPQPWQLKQLQERGVVDFYELKDGRLACYFRDLKPGEVVTINLDLKAEMPGTYAAPASVAYLYYTDEFKWWVPGVVARVKA